MKFLKKQVLIINNNVVIYLDLWQKIYKRYFFITENWYSNKFYTNKFIFFVSFEKYLIILLIL